ncbi:hypothetical protein BDR26DRAFT_922107 [Obelidium mucronatum]|nr:hypothetical protein BDR26DRAFT_922107 [Obelidium mucronatum]
MSELLAEIRTLTVPKLKEICRDIGERVGGSKADLLQRIEFQLQQRSASAARLAQLRAAVLRAKGLAGAAPGAGAAAAAPKIRLTMPAAAAALAAPPPPPARPPGADLLSGAALQRFLGIPVSAQAQLHKPAASTTTTAAATPQPSIESLKFRTSPFYSLLPRKLVTRAYPCDTGKAQIKFMISQTELNSLLIGSDVLLLFVGARDGKPLTSKPNPFKVSGIPVEYPLLEGAHSNAPNHCAIMMNGSVVQHTLYSGIRGKPWTQKPLELNKFIHKNPSVYNSIDLKFTPILNESRELIVVVQFASRVALPQIVESLMRDRLIPKDSILAERRQKISTDDDICLTEEHVSLKDPVTRSRITVPARGNLCRHPQCFDLEYYLQLNQTHPTWTCPVCSKLAPIHEVFVDGYFLELLKSASFDLDIESAEIAMDGTWQLNKEEKTGVSSDESDDDYGGHHPAKRQKVEPSTAAGAASNSNCIDLTLSDDEAPPIAPIRQQPVTSNSANSQVPPTPHVYTRPVDITPSYSQSPSRLTPQLLGRALNTQIVPTLPGNTSTFPESQSAQVNMAGSAPTSMPDTHQQQQQKQQPANSYLNNTSFSISHAPTLLLSESSFGSSFPQIGGAGSSASANVSFHDAFQQRQQHATTTTPPSIFAMKSALGSGGSSSNSAFEPANPRHVEATNHNNNNSFGGLAAHNQVQIYELQQLQQKQQQQQQQ